MIRAFAVICFILLSAELHAQTRLSENNSIGWYTTTGTIRFNKRLSAHLEYQWRRNDWINTWQQSLLRTGINYHLNDQVTFRLGYGWIETYPYGDYPLNKFGKQFTEHRLYQLAGVSHKIGRVELLHRYMLEQRWIATYVSQASASPDSWTYLNRLRYMCRLQVPLKGETLENGEPYLAGYDEIMIGFGEQVGQNVFDQNRVGIMLGCKISDAVRVEGGYLQQVLQLGRQIENKNVFQFNQGIILNSVWVIDLKK